jgi:hypothetical protein
MDAIRGHFDIPKQKLDEIVEHLKQAFALTPKTSGPQLLYQSRYQNGCIEEVKPGSQEIHYVPGEQEGLQLGDFYFCTLTLAVENRQDLVDVYFGGGTSIGRLAIKGEVLCQTTYSFDQLHLIGEALVQQFKNVNGFGAHAVFWNVVDFWNCFVKIVTDDISTIRPYYLPEFSVMFFQRTFGIYEKEKATQSKFIDDFMEKRSQVVIAEMLDLPRPLKKEKKSSNCVIL